MTISDKSREQHDAWYAEYSKDWTPSIRYACRNEFWPAWQASRASVAVDLPPAPEVPEDPEEAIDDSHMDAYHAANHMRLACQKAIEAAGMKVKP